MPRIILTNEPELPPARRQFAAKLAVDTDGRGLVDLSAAIFAWLRRERAGDGLLTVFIRHTSASLTIQENADPDVRSDLVDALDRLAPEDAGWHHAEEGPDDMPAHVKAALTATSLVIPVVGGAPDLGTWQAIYLIEHRRAPHHRELRLAYIGS